MILKTKPFFSSGKDDWTVAVRFILLALFFVCLTACSTEEVDPVPDTDPPVTNTKYFESVGKSKVFESADLIRAAFDLGAGESLPISLPSDVPRIKVEEILYHTVDPEGNDVIASGIISYPESGNYSRIVLGEHFTISANEEAPSSRMCAMESVLSLFDCFVISPDYLGFGVTRDKRHPYLHAESTARVSIDMVFAVREYMESLESPLSKDIYIVGYSQGGASALAVHREMEKNHAADFNILYTMAGGGPHDLEGMFNDVVTKDFTSYPGSIPMIVIGLDYGDQLGLDYSKVFKGSLLSNYNDWINSKKYTMGNINGKIGSNKASDFMHADMFTTSRNSDFDKLYASLKKNSLLDWTPKAPIFLAHGTSDEVVPSFCSQNAYDSFKAKGANVELRLFANEDHKGAAIPFYLFVLLRF